MVERAEMHDPTRPTPNITRHEAKVEVPRRDFLSSLARLPLVVSGGGLLLACGAAKPGEKPGNTDAQQGDATVAGDSAQVDAAVSDTSANDAAVNDTIVVDTAKTDSAATTDSQAVGDGATPPDAAADTTAGQIDANTDTCSTDAAVSPPQPCTVTGADIEGPYYEANATSTVVLAGPNEPGDRLRVVGRVLGHTCTAAIADAKIEVWHADASGVYRDLTHATPLRATMLADCSGRFAFDTIYPGAYLNSGTYRPRHIHFRVTSPAGAVLITQLYFAGDPNLGPKDSCGSCSSSDPSHIVKLNAVPGPKTSYLAVFNIVL